jgi:hypothetical protein
MRHKHVLLLLLLVLASFQKQLAAELVAYGRGKVSWVVYSAERLATGPRWAFHQFHQLLHAVSFPASQHSTAAASSSISSSFSGEAHLLLLPLVQRAGGMAWGNCAAVMEAACVSP